MKKSQKLHTDLHTKLRTKKHPPPPKSRCSGRRGIFQPILSYSEVGSPASIRAAFFSADFFSPAVAALYAM